MGIDYYGFQNQSEIFGKKDVRLAFNYAINRDKLVTYTLQGDGIPANYGIVPPSFKGYDHKLIRGFSFKPDTAQKLLAAAGYPNGKGFPKLTLQINSGGERNVQVAEVIQKMLKENLNVDVDINVMPMAEHMENFETGKALFWRTSWIADYPDPETFLTILYGKHVPEKLTDRSYVNAVRYKSAKFDSLFELALSEVDTKKRFDLYREADQVAMDDAAIMPIFYHENYRLVQLWVKNCEANAMEYRDMSRVYFIPKDEVKKQ
jgi:peptide/nickel transport system substrate-binding protein